MKKEDINQDHEEDSLEETIETFDEKTSEEPDGEEPDGEEPDGEEPDGEEPDGDLDEGLTITFDGQDEPDEGDGEDEEIKKAPQWVKDLRKKVKDQAKKLRQYEEAEKDPKTEEKITLGDKPTLADCDYDEEVFEQKIETWHKQKLEFEKKQEEKTKKEDEEKIRFQKKVDSFNEKKKVLPVKDFDEAEEFVGDIANGTQVGIILQGSQDPTTLMYALYKNPKKAKEIFAIENPIDFAFAVSKLEGKLKVEPRKVKTKPEKIVTGSQKHDTNKTLENLRKEAEKTGNYTKVVAYKKSLKK